MVKRNLGRSRGPRGRHGWTAIGIPPSRPPLATPIALIMRAPTLTRTARLGAGKYLFKKFARAATLPPVPTEKDVPVREADTQMKEVVEWGKLVDEYSKLSNTSKPDAARFRGRGAASGAPRARCPCRRSTSGRRAAMF